MITDILTVLAIVAAVIPLATTAAIFGALGAPRPAIDWIYRNFSRFSVWVTRVRLLPVVWHTDRAHLPPRLVIVCNHESHMDAPSILASLHERSIRFVAKAELFRIPFFGWGLGATGNIRVERNHTAADLGRLREASARPSDSDVLFFAEGTRSREGAYRAFKKGAFALAIQQQLPILPVAIGGSYECVRPHTLQIRPGKIAVVVGEPIDVRGMTLADRDALRDRVQQIVARLRQEALQLAESPRAALS